MAPLFMMLLLVLLVHGQRIFACTIACEIVLPQYKNFLLLYLRGRRHQLSVLESVYPAGGRCGTAVAVGFLGPQGSFKGANEIVVDGPPGVTARNVKAVGDNRVEAELVIAADAPLGRRMLRVKGGPKRKFQR